MKLIKFDNFVNLGWKESDDEDSCMSFSCRRELVQDGKLCELSQEGEGFELSQEGEAVSVASSTLITPF